MVHHGLAPGQSGDDAQRRLYVDLLAFPAGQTPRLAPRPPAAALAEALLYFGDPNAPPQPDVAFLGLLHKVPSAFSHDTDQALDGGRAARVRRSCATSRAPTTSSIPSPAVGWINSKQAWSRISATEYFCPQDGLQALKDVQQALT